MGDEQRSKVLKVALASGSILILGVGLYFALGGEWYGWLIAAFGLLDLATVPFVARLVTQGAGAAGGSLSPVSIGNPVTERTSQRKSGGGTRPLVQPLRPRGLTHTRQVSRAVGFSSGARLWHPATEAKSA